MARRLGVTAVLVAALAAGSVAAAAGDPREPQHRFDAADQAWAHRIIVQRADLGAGDWRVQQLDSQGDGTAPSYCKNPNLSDLVLSGQAKSPDFGREDSFEDSDGEVWSSESDAIASFKRLKTYPFDRCFKVAMKQEFAQGSGVKFSVVSSGPIAIGTLAPRQLTYGLKFRITVGGRKIDGRIDIYAFSRGRADGSVMIASLGAPARPIPLSLERKLATLVAHRLKH
ncbi:MAG: hypothetical protein ACJ74M_12410 [Gaiellaceae bacterium]